MGYEDATEIMWDENQEDMLEDDASFLNHTNSDFNDDGGFYDQDSVPPPQSMVPEELERTADVDTTFEDMLDMSIYDGFDMNNGPSDEEDVPISTVVAFDENFSIVSSPSSTGIPTQCQVPNTISPEVSFRSLLSNKGESSESSDTIPHSDELTAQYTEAITRFAASMRRSEETRSEILRQKLVVPDIKGFNAGVQSRNKLWSAMDDSTRSTNSQ